MNLIDATRQHDTLTENGAITHSTSLSNVLDLYFMAGACRERTEEDIRIKLEKAYAEDKAMTLRLIFWAGDIRSGAGERFMFRTSLEWLTINHPEDVLNNLHNIPFYNRYDSLWKGCYGINDKVDNEILKMIKETLINE